MPTPIGAAALIYVYSIIFACKTRAVKISNASEQQHHKPVCADTQLQLPVSIKQTLYVSADQQTVNKCS